MCTNCGYLCWSSHITSFSTSVRCHLSPTSWSSTHPQTVVSVCPERNKKREKCFGGALATSKWPDVSNAHRGGEREDKKGKVHLKTTAEDLPGTSHEAGWSQVERKAVKHTGEGGLLFLYETAYRMKENKGQGGQWAWSQDNAVRQVWNSKQHTNKKRTFKCTNIQTHRSSETTRRGTIWAWGGGVGGGTHKQQQFLWTAPWNSLPT